MASTSPPPAACPAAPPPAPPSVRCCCWASAAPPSWPSGSSAPCSAGETPSELSPSANGNDGTRWRTGKTAGKAPWEHSPFLRDVLGRSRAGPRCFALHPCRVPLLSHGPHGLAVPASPARPCHTPGPAGWSAPAAALPAAAPSGHKDRAHVGSRPPQFPPSASSTAEHGRTHRTHSHARSRDRRHQNPQREDFGSFLY